MFPSWFGMLPVVAPLVVIGLLAVHLVRRQARIGAARRASVDWAQTSGTVVMSAVQVRRVGNSRTEHPAVAYLYQVGGQMLQGTRVRVGDDLGGISVAGDAQRIVERYPAGAAVTVFYDPRNPASSALER